MRGEKEAGHKGTREVGNVNPETEITMQFGANERDAEGEDCVFCFVLFCFLSCVPARIQRKA